MLIINSIFNNNISIEISHWFSAKENDWGYASFLPWKVPSTCTCIWLLV